MTYAQQRQTYTNDGTRRRKVSHENRTIDNITTKKFLTNTDKSMFNLKWEVGGVAQQNYQRSRNHSQHHTSREQDNHKPDQKRSMPLPNVANSDETPSGITAYSISYVYPPEQVTKPQGTNRITKKSGITQSEKSVDLVRNTNELKIEYYYVDSSDEAEKLIDNLRRKEFVETGISRPAVDRKNKKK